MSNTITTVTFYYSGEVQMDLTEDDIKEIAKKHGGDYEKFIRNMKPDRWDIELDLQGEEYNRNIIERALNLYSLHTPEIAESLNLSTSREVLQISKEIYALGHTSKEDITQLDIDREMLSIVATIAASNHPQDVINCVYFGMDDIVATDTKKLIIHKNTTGLNGVLINKAICLEYAQNAEAKLSMGSDVIYLSSNGKYYAHPLKNFGRYPAYHRIIPEDLTEKISKAEFTDRTSLYLEEHNASTLMDDVLAFKTMQDKDLWISNGYIPKFEFDTFGYIEPNKPVIFESENIKYIVMTMHFVGSDERRLIAQAQ